MKRLIREYIALLKEREELDAILPNLLRQMNFEVLSEPRRGTAQHGVDIPAVGSLNAAQESVYLFSIKPGNLTHASWNGPSTQSLRQSLDKIIDVYIPTKLPVRYRELPIIICICIGGVINEEVTLAARHGERSEGA